MKNTHKYPWAFDSSYEIGKIKVLNVTSIIEVITH